MLRHRTYPSRQRIMDVLEEHGYPISIKTFEKDIETLRYEFDLDIQYHSKRKGYYYGKDNTQFDVVFSDDELALILMALKNLRPFEGSFVVRSIISTLEKIAKRMRISIDEMKYISNRVHFGNVYPNTGMRMCLFKVLDSMFCKQKVSIRYYSDGDYKSVEIIPLYLVEDDNGYYWYTIGQRNDGSLRRYKIEDIDVQVIPKYYDDDDVLHPNLSYWELMSIELEN
jgi:predicted DNA-binding transcriptional regulator YafY